MTETLWLELLYLVGYIVITLNFIRVWQPDEDHPSWVNGLNFLNPVLFHNNVSVNWFGAIFMCLLFSTMLLPYAIGYWFYKLCTVGRRQ